MRLGETSPSREDFAALDREGPASPARDLPCFHRELAVPRAAR